jgi:hypothetical protein
MADQSGYNLQSTIELLNNELVHTPIVTESGDYAGQPTYDTITDMTDELVQTPIVTESGDGAGQPTYDRITDMTDDSEQPGREVLESVSEVTQQPSTSSCSIFSEANEQRVGEPERVATQLTKRKRMGEWKKQERKRLRNTGLPYKQTTGETSAGKPFKNIDCHCPLKCTDRLKVETRKQLHSSFWSLGSWAAQTAFIVGHVMSSEKKKSYGTSDRRKFSRQYYLSQNGIKIRICKKTFMQTLCLDSARIHRAIQKEQQGNMTDLRGKHKPHNKLPDDELQFALEFILSFPMYESHYTRQHSQKKYFSSQLNRATLHRLYTAHCEEFRRKPISISMFTGIINANNLSFTSPLKDTCNTCDSLHVQMQQENDDDVVHALKVKKELHLRKADAARASMRRDGEKAQDPANQMHTIFFDLQKALPTPKIPTNKVYYLRQLWCYNLGIHDCGSDNGYMYVWDETMASRGSQEVMSCLHQYLLSENMEQIKHLAAYSDACGGQNRNFKIALFWMHITQRPDISVEVVDHKFMESGHSFGPSDSDFADIEKKAKKQDRIYTPEEWFKIIEDSRIKNKFHVTRMNTNMFVGTQELETVFTRRLKTEDGHKVEWLKIKHMRFSKAAPGVMEFKYDYSDAPMMAVSFSKRGVNLADYSDATNMTPLWPQGRGILKAKKDDLMKLLEFIPPCFHSWYNDIRIVNARVSESIDGFSADADFERETDAL